MQRVSAKAVTGTRYDASRPFDVAAPVHLAALAVLLAAMVAIIAAVWLFEWWGYAPCELCLVQRRPYYFAIPAAVGGIVAVFLALPACAARGMLAIVGLCLSATALLAGYHAGVEWGFFPAPETCGAGISAGVSDAGSLLADLATATPPKCDEAAGRFLGLSFAGWNLVFAVPLAWAAFAAAAREGLRGRAAH